MRKKIKLVVGFITAALVSCSQVKELKIDKDFSSRLSSSYHTLSSLPLEKGSYDIGFFAWSDSCQCGVFDIALLKPDQKREYFPVIVSKGQYFFYKQFFDVQIDSLTSEKTRSLITESCFGKTDFELIQRRLDKQSLYIGVGPGNSNVIGEKGLQDFYLNDCSDCDTVLLLRTSSK